MYRVGIAEQVVEVPQDLLIGAQEKSAQIIIAALKGMEGERALHVAAVDEGVHLAVGIASDIAQDGMPRRFLIQTVNGHDREKLLDGPTVGHALKQREIAEVRVREHGVDAFQL